VDTESKNIKPPNTGKSREMLPVPENYALEKRCFQAELENAVHEAQHGKGKEGGKKQMLSPPFQIKESINRYGYTKAKEVYE